MYDPKEQFKCLAYTGWPADPHTIVDFYEDDGVLYVRTDKGCSLAIKYFKIIETKQGN